MFWLLFLKFEALCEALIDKFVYVGVEWNKMADNQWNLVNYNVNLTDKGTAVIGDLATIIHNGLDFVAQLATFLPANNGVFLNSQNGPYIITGA